MKGPKDPSRSLFAQPNGDLLRNLNYLIPNQYLSKLLMKGVGVLGHLSTMYLHVITKNKK